MDISEVIRKLNQDKEIIKENTEINDLEEIDVAIKVLEKQIPKKPIMRYNYEDGFDRTVCPVCELPPRVYKSDDYCCQCGQKLEWD